MFSSGPDKGPIGMNTQASSNSVYEEKQQPKGCRDPLFSILFIANLAIIAYLAASYGSNPFSEVAEFDDDASASKPSYTGFIYAAAGGGGLSAILSALCLMLILAIPGFLIKFAIFFNFAIMILIAIWGFAYGGFGVGLFALLLLSIFACYIWAVWDKIPFATANLVTGTTAIKHNCGVTLIGYFTVIVAFGWSILWAVVVMGLQHKLIDCEEIDGKEVCSNPNYLVYFLLLISYFFVHQVLKNVVHVTVAGVIGSWWFEPSSRGCCGASIAGSFIRSITTSFGSICFGSLIVAILQAIRALVDYAKNNDDINGALACCIDCILSCLESLMEYFNKWAFVYVGLYGYGYCEAGKSVMTLFKDRGWDAIIADDLVGMVLGMLSFVVGLIVGAVSMLFVVWTDWFDEYIGFFDGDDGELNAKFLVFILGFVIGLVMCSILMGSIDSSVLAVIVLFAEAPAEFDSNYPELSRQMRDAYASAYPGYE